MLHHHFRPDALVEAERLGKTHISLVISHCEGDLSWIPFFMKEKKYKIKDVTIYSKCSKDVEGIHAIFSLAPTEVLHYDNVGRNDHTYALYIQQHFEKFQEEKDSGDDIIFFMKDNEYFFDKNLPYNDMDEMFTQTFETGFSCLAKPTCDCSLDCEYGKMQPTMMHDTEFLFGFNLNHYSRVKRDKNDIFLSMEYPTLKSWYDDVGFRPPPSKTVPVCYTGVFAIKKRQIFNHPKKVWDTMVKTLTRGDNIIEGHYAERTWANVLSYNDERIALQLDRSLLPRVKKMVGRTQDGTEAGGICGMRGMLYTNLYLPKKKLRYSGKLAPLDRWISHNGRYYLTFHRDGRGLAFRKRLKNGEVQLLWRTPTKSPGGYATLHDSGELDIVDGNGVKVFTNGLTGITGAYIKFGKGHFYICDGGGKIVQSFP